MKEIIKIASDTSDTNRNNENLIKFFHSFLIIQGKQIKYQIRNYFIFDNQRMVKKFFKIIKCVSRSKDGKQKLLKRLPTHFKFFRYHL